MKNESDIKKENSKILIFLILKLYNSNNLLFYNTKSLIIYYHDLNIYIVR